MDHIAGVEKVFVEFFANIKAKLRSLQAEQPQHWGASDHAFHRVFCDTKETVARSLADDFDTPSAMTALQVRFTQRSQCASHWAKRSLDNGISL
jgi:cysteinyl-tRNA synthetase